MSRNIAFGRSSHEDLGMMIDPDKIDFAPACDQLDSIRPQDHFNLSPCGSNPMPKCTGWGQHETHPKLRVGSSPSMVLKLPSLNQGMSWMYDPWFIQS